MLPPLLHPTKVQKNQYEINIDLQIFLFFMQNFSLFYDLITVSQFSSHLQKPVSDSPKVYNS